MIKRYHLEVIMKSTKIVCSLLICALLIGTAALLSGCGGNGDLEFSLYMNEQIHVPNKEYNLYFKEYNDAVNVNLDKVVFEVYDDQGANATISGNVIIATGSGSVQVKATYKHGGKVYEEYERFYFRPLDIIMSLNGNADVGRKVPLLISARCCGQNVTDNTYEEVSVISGNAVIECINGIYTIKATSSGEVTIRVKSFYVNQTYTAEGTFYFDNLSLAITSDKTEGYVGEDVNLSASSELYNIDPSRLVYTVVSGNATISGSILRASSPGEVVVSATYEDNGEIYKSNELNLNFVYDGNVITNVDGLLALNNSSATYFLESDIDLSSIEEWTPIENFTGTLYGGGYTIKGLNIVARSMEENKGLFATLGGTVEDLKLEGKLTCRGEASRLGLLCGTNNGTIKNVSVSGSIDTQYCDYVGGIAGYSDNSYITGCTTNVSITARNYVGGHVGYMMAVRSADVVLEDNINEGNIIGCSYVGGIYGDLHVSGSGRNNDIITVINNVNNGSITGSEQYIGGLIGFAEGERHSERPNIFGDWYDYTGWIHITESENTADIIGSDYVGGILGNGNNYVKEISFTTNSGNVSGNNYVGGYAGRANGTHLRNLTNNVTVTGKSYVGGIAGYAGKIDGCVNNGEINVVGYSLEGNNHAVSYVGGVAGYASGAVSCVNNSNIDATGGGDYIGGIAGYVFATRSADNVIQKNKNHGAIMGQGYVGGVFGYLGVEGSPNNEDDITVVANENDGEIAGYQNYVGGIIGYAVGEIHSVAGTYGGSTAYLSKIKIMECVNEANVTGVDYVGGILGNGENYVAEISFATNEGNVSGNCYVGGYAGRANGTEMRTLINNSTISGKSYVGGIAGYAGKCITCQNNGDISNQGYSITSDNQAISYIGGIAGYLTGAENCTNNSNINASTGGDYVGGIAGYLLADRSVDNEIKGNKNHGTINGTAYVGGIFGYLGIDGGPNNSDTITVKSNINDGDVTGSKDYVGGIIGYAVGESHNVRQTLGGYYTYTSYLKVMECKDEANVNGVDYVGGIVGSAHQYVMPDEVIWNTNIIDGNVTAEGDNAGVTFGYMG